LKKLLLIFSLFLSILSFAQNTKSAIPQKKANQAPNQIPPKGTSNNQTQSLTTPLEHDTCLNKKFSIVFYVILDSAGLPGQASPPNLNMLLDTLNDRFKRICVTFMNCSTVYIPNYKFNIWDRNSTDTTVTNLYYTEKTINIYMVDSIKNNFATEAAGYSFGPPATMNGNSKDVIVLEKWQILIANSVIPLHHMGHFFGLYHTHDEINPALNTVPPTPAGVISKEFVDGSNCATHGDGLCDTEADPSSSGVLKDGKGHYYVKPLDNYMGFHSSACRFTQQQYNRMARIIMTRRLYLH